MMENTNLPSTSNEQTATKSSLSTPSTTTTATKNEILRNLLSGDHLFSVMLSFLPTMTIFLIYTIINAIMNLGAENGPDSIYKFSLVITLVVFGNAIGFMTLSSVMNFPIYWRSSLLSNIFFIGYTIAKQNAFISINGLGYYMMAMSFFHLSEYVFTALFNSKQVSTDSFLLNHSLEYGLAAMASWFEYLLELYFIPSIKTALITRILGLLLVMFGETFRKMAMYTAGTNFNHYVQETKQQDHELVTSGIYSLVRHPSYFGWFYWSIGTQLLLANPICLVAYTVTSWKFFNSRIVYEEYFLRKFFGKKYVEYQKRVPTGIPLIIGFTDKLD